MEKKEGWTPGHFLKKGMEKVKGSGTEEASPLPPSAQAEDSFSARSFAAAELGGDELVPGPAPLSAMPMFTTTSEPFYLNVVVVDSSAAVAQQVEGKLGKGFWGKQATKLAKGVVTNSKVAEKLASQLVDKIPAAVAQKGIQLECDVKFQFGSLVVLKARVVEVTPVELVRVAKGDKFAASFSAMLDAFGELDLKEAIEKVNEKVQLKVNEALCLKMEEILPEKLAEQGVISTVVAKPEAEQAAFFFDFIGRLQSTE